MTGEVLGIRAFRIYAGCIIVSFVGNSSYLAAVTWLIFRMTGRPWAIPALFLVSAIPGVIFAPMVARVVAQVDLRRLLMLVDVCSGIVVLLGPLADLMGLLTPAQLYVQEFVVAFGGALFFVASRSFVREIVPADRLLPANSVMVGVFQVGNTFGALVGGLLVQLTSPSTAMTVNAVTFFISALGLWAVKSGERAAAPVIETNSPLPRKNLWADFGAMGRIVLRNKKIQIFFVCFLAIAGLQRFLLGALQPFVAQDLDGGPLVFGIIQSAMAVGAFLGSNLLPRLERRWGRNTTLAALVVATVPLVCLFGVSVNPVMATAIYLGLGLMTQVLAIAQTSIQENETTGTAGGQLALLGMMQSVAVVCVFGVATGITALLGTRLTYVTFGLMFGVAVARPIYFLLTSQETNRNTPETSVHPRHHR